MLVSNLGRIALINFSKLGLVPVVLFVILGSAYGADSENKNTSTEAEQATTDAEIVDSKDNASTAPSLPADFFGQWGVGLAMIRSQQPTIADATVVNGVARVNSRFENEATWLVARHFYPWSPGRKCLSHIYSEPKDDKRSGDRFEKKNPLCIGAMVGVGLGATGGAGNGQLINFGGIGLTIGGRLLGIESTRWNLGFGVGRKFNVRVLGDGIVENKLLPEGETQIRYKEIDTRANFAYFAINW